MMNDELIRYSLLREILVAEWGLFWDFDDVKFKFRGAVAAIAGVGQ